MTRRRFIPVATTLVGLFGLSTLLGVLGVVLLVTRNVQLGDNVASVLSLVLAVVLAGVTLLVWFRRSRTADRQERDAEALLSAPEDHWLRSARGADERRGFFFTGRSEVLSTLASVAVAGVPGLAVLLGMPGAGKSAVLSVLVVRGRAAGELPDDLAEQIPEVPINCAVHARGKTVTEIVAELAAAFGASVDPAHGQESLFRELTQRAEHIAVIVVDAVDEADSPYELAVFLSRLSWHAVVLTGTRPDEAADPGVTASPPEGMRARASTVVDLSAAGHVDREAVARYVRARLRTDRREDGYAGHGWTDLALLQVVGREVAAGAGDNFLVAQLITDELLSRPPVRHVERGWSRSMDWPHDFAGWMSRDLGRRLGTRGWLADALVPLAFAERDGLPFDLWVGAAAGLGLDRRIDRAAVEQALRELGFFVAATTNTATSEAGFLLRHQQFTDYFRRRRSADDHRRTIASVVLDDIPRRPDGSRDWARARPYARRSVLAHARDAQTLEALLSDDPRCLAVVDPAAAIDATALLDGHALTRLVRRTAYGGGSSYRARCAQLAFHARLAGDSELADVFGAETIGTTDPSVWATPWRAGGAAATIPSGEPLYTTALLPVRGPRPTAIVIDRAFRGEAIELPTRAPRGPMVDLHDGGIAPTMWAARTIGGSDHLVVASDEGTVALWCLAGDSVSATATATRRVPGSIRSVDVLAGPGGIPVVALLTGGRPSELTLWTAADGSLSRIGEPITGGDRIGGPVAWESSIGLLVASLGSGLRLVRVDATMCTPTQLTVTDARVTLLADASERDRSVALVSIDHRIHAVVCLDGRADVIDEPLGDGGPSARPALLLADGVARAAVVADGELAVWELIPQLRRIADQSVDVELRDATFLGPSGEFLALHGFSGDVRIVSATDPALGTGRAVLPVGELGTAVLAAPSDGPDPATVVTRAPSGTTKIWTFDEQPPRSDGDGLDTITALAVASGRTGPAVVATDRTQSVRLWQPGQAEAPQTLKLGDEVWAVATAVDDRTDSAIVAAIGDHRAGCWTVRTGDARGSTWEVPDGLTDHLTVSRASARTIVVAAGPEGVGIWDADDTEHGPISHLDVPVSAFATTEGDGRLVVLVVDEDDVLRELIVDGSGIADRRTTVDGPVTALIPVTDRDGRPGVVTAADDGTLTTWDLRAHEIETRRSVTLPERPTPIAAVPTEDGTVLAFPAPAAGIVLWDPTGNDSATLIRTGSAQGRIAHLVAVGRHSSTLLLAASTTGTIASIDPVSGAVAELTVNCEFSHLAGLSDPGWAFGTQGAVVVALDPGPQAERGPADF